jgi:uncharacterized protein (DUF433 family)
LLAVDIVLAALSRGETKHRFVAGFERCSMKDLQKPLLR